MPTVRNSPRPPSRTRAERALATFTVLLATVFATACGKKIGDACQTTNDCSLNQDRRCDLTQPSGYCTVPECTPDSCPDHALCVEFDSNIPRLARRFCVQSCAMTSNCRGGYACVQPTVGPYDNCPEAPEGTNASPPVCNRLVDHDAAVFNPADAALPSGYCIQAQ